jgi:hypothetical protein
MPRNPNQEEMAGFLLRLGIGLGYRIPTEARIISPPGLAALTK